MGSVKNRTKTDPARRIGIQDGWSGLRVRSSPRPTLPWAFRAIGSTRVPLPRGYSGHKIPEFSRLQGTSLRKIFKTNELLLKYSLSIS